jgi:peptidoglycan/xylan/chitin deacetylase (PgdA/CDA1 family)
VIGNHSYSHAWHISDYDQAEAVIAHATGQPTRFVRAASYDYDACMISPVVQTRLVIDANVNPGDCFQTNPDDVFDLIMNDPHLGSGAIVNLHDGAEFDDHAQRLSRPLPTIQALPRVIEELQRQGYELVTLGQLLFEDPLVWAGKRDPRDIVRVNLSGRPELRDRQTVPKA